MCVCESCRVWLRHMHACMHMQGLLMAPGHTRDRHRARAFLIDSRSAKLRSDRLSERPSRRRSTSGSIARRSQPGMSTNVTRDSWRCVCGAAGCTQATRVAQQRAGGRSMGAQGRVSSAGLGCPLTSAVVAIRPNTNALTHMHARTHATARTVTRSSSPCTAAGAYCATVMVKSAVLRSCTLPRSITCG
jgi:hypothetical protein